MHVGAGEESNEVQIVYLHFAGSLFSRLSSVVLILVIARVLSTTCVGNARVTLLFFKLILFKVLHLLLLSV